MEVTGSNPAPLTPTKILNRHLYSVLVKYTPVKLLFLNLLKTVLSFFQHNGPVVFFSLGALVALLKTIHRPSRTFILIFLGFLTLIFSFEYRKHFIPQTQTHVVQQLVDPEVNARDYARTDRFFTSLFPVLLDIGGWGLIFAALLFLKEKERD